MPKKAPMAWNSEFYSRISWSFASFLCFHARTLNRASRRFISLSVRCLTLLILHSIRKRNLVIVHWIHNFLCSLNSLQSPHFVFKELFKQKPRKPVSPDFNNILSSVILNYQVAAVGFPPTIGSQLALSQPTAVRSGSASGITPEL